MEILLSWQQPGAVQCCHLVAGVDTLFKGADQFFEFLCFYREAEKCIPSECTDCCMDDGTKILGQLYEELMALSLAVFRLNLK